MDPTHCCLESQEKRLAMASQHSSPDQKQESHPLQNTSVETPETIRSLKIGKGCIFSAYGHDIWLECITIF